METAKIIIIGGIKVTKTKKILGFLLAVLMMFSMFTVSISAAGNTMATATSINIGTTYNGSITETNKSDFYKFTLSSSGRINIRLTAYIYSTTYYIYDTNSKTVWSSTESWDGTSEVLKLDKDLDLTSGTYYFVVEKNYGTGNYNFKLSFTSANESFKETTNGINNKLATASSISIGTTYNGQIASNDEKDFYKFTLSSSGRINLRLTAYIYSATYYIYDTNSKTVWSSTESWDDTSEVLKLDKDLDLTSGTYYFVVEKNYGTGNYNFKISFTNANESFKETTNGINNTIATASSISTGTTYYGQIAANDSKDTYKLTISSSGKIKLSLTAYINTINFYIYDTNGKTVWSLTKWWDNTSEEINLNENIDLTSGTYYFVIEKNYGTGNYNFSFGAKTPSGPLCPNGHVCVNHYCSVCGKFEKGFTGMAKKNGTWQYVKNGGADNSYTGLAKNQYGWWYLTNGKIDYKYVGLAKNQYGWWYIKNGTINYKYIGMAKNQYGWWYVKNGTIDFKYTGMAKNQYGWWYMRNGKLDTTYTGIARNTYGYWYMQNGKLNGAYSGIYIDSNGNYWSVTNGKAIPI